MRGIYSTRLQTMETSKLARKNVLELNNVASSRQIMKVLLDMAESPYNGPYNRYPDPQQTTLRQRIAEVKRVNVEQMCLGNGSEELVDNLLRCFCEPRIDNVVAIEPTRTTYRECAARNDVEYRPVTLDGNFGITAERLLDHTDANTKIIWICSPNFPTGTPISRDETELLLELFDGIVVVDESYADFVRTRPFRADINRHDNLVVLNTMSKAWGSAAARLGMAFADKAIIDIMNRMRLPYNISSLAQNYFIELLKDPFETDKNVTTIVLERHRLMEAFSVLPSCERVFPSATNFFLAKFTDAPRVFSYLADNGILVRDCSHMPLCDNCLLITVGTKNENNLLLAALRKLQ